MSKNFVLPAAIVDKFVMNLQSMRARYIWVFSLFLVALFLADPALAQKRSKYSSAKFRNNKISKSTGRAGKFRPYDYLGVGLNALNYYGDLAPLSHAASTDVSFTRPGLGSHMVKGLRPLQIFGLTITMVESKEMI